MLPQPLRARAPAAYHSPSFTFYLARNEYVRPRFAARDRASRSEGNPGLAPAGPPHESAEAAPAAARQAHRASVLRTLDADANFIRIRRQVAGRNDHGRTFFRLKHRKRGIDSRHRIHAAR